MTQLRPSPSPSSSALELELLGKIPNETSNQNQKQTQQKQKHTLIILTLLYPSSEKVISSFRQKLDSISDDTKHEYEILYRPISGDENVRNPPTKEEMKRASAVMGFGLPEDV